MILITSWQMLVKIMTTDGVRVVCTKVHTYRAQNITLEESVGKTGTYSRVVCSNCIFRRILHGGGQYQHRHLQRNKTSR